MYGDDDDDAYDLFGLGASNSSYDEESDAVAAALGLDASASPPSPVRQSSPSPMAAVAVPTPPMPTRWDTAPPPLPEVQQQQQPPAQRRQQRPPSPPPPPCRKRARSDIMDTLTFAFGSRTPAAMAMQGKSRPCFLCDFGNRVVDASNKGSLLFTELLRLTEETFPVREAPKVVDLIERFVHDYIRPTYEAEHGVGSLPPIDRAAVFEHLTTTKHTVNGRIFHINQIRMLSDVQHTLYRQVQTLRIEEDEDRYFRSVDQVRRLSETLKKFYESNPTQYAYGATVSMDINPIVSATISDALVQHRLVAERPPFVASFLERLARENAAETTLPHTDTADDDDDADEDEDEEEEEEEEEEDDAPPPSPPSPPPPRSRPRGRPAKRRRLDASNSSFSACE